MYVPKLLLTAANDDELDALFKRKNKQHGPYNSELVHAL